jgi:hypothetical protein
MAKDILLALAFVVTLSGAVLLAAALALNLRR